MDDVETRPEPRHPMTINIELKPDDERALLERARVSGCDLAGYVHHVLERHLRNPEPERHPDEIANGANLSLEDLIDWEAIASCAKEADDSITLEEVRAATAKIKDSMARVVIEEERAERF
jgi:hypothetical protein